MERLHIHRCEALKEKGGAKLPPADLVFEVIGPFGNTDALERDREFWHFHVPFSHFSSEEALRETVPILHKCSN